MRWCHQRGLDKDPTLIGKVVTLAGGGVTGTGVRSWRMLCHGGLLRRLMRILLFILPLGVVVLGTVSCQSSLIYPGQRYAPATWEKVPPGVEALRYRTDQGEQVSFYRPPAHGGEPRRLWLMCNGNGGYALQWLALLHLVPDREAGFLLFEYPGYGFSEGSCTPGRILAASEGAVEALRARLALPDLDARLGVLGHSLGAAAALQYAARHPVRRIVLAAPFTSMVDMGHHMLFWPLGQVIWHRFDNVDRLAEIAAQRPRPPLLILHGGDDPMIPPTMSATLAEPYPGWIERCVVPGINHDAIVLDALRSLDGV